jgi:hypothetical protein
MQLYTINKGVNKPVEFRGLKAQYILYLGAGLALLLLLFALLYICGVSPFICVGIIGTCGVSLFVYIYHLSHTYGEHGVMKKMARRRLPRLLRATSRHVFRDLSRRNGP